MPGVIGRAFQLDGSTGYLSTADNPGTLSINSTITISAWVNPAVTKIDNVIIDKTQTGDAANYRFGIHGNKLFFYNGSTAVLSTATIPLDTFTQVALTLDASTNTLKFYINGALDSTQTIGFGGLNAAAVTIGRDIIGRFFQGLIDEVQVYNTILTANQVQVLYSTGVQPAPLLLDSWKGDGNTLDSVGPSTGTTAGDVSYGPGIAGQAFSLGGNGSYVDLGTGSDVTGTGAFAVGAWIKTTADGVIINQRDANNYDGEYYLAVSGGKINWSIFGGGTSEFNFTSNRTVADGQWHYVLAQRLTDGTGQIYIDGFWDSSRSATPEPLGSGFHVYIGEDVRNVYFGSPPGNFVGQIDEVRIYSGALSPAQAQLLANVPSGLSLDQQGGVRPVDGIVDIGAVEYQHGSPSGVDIEVQPVDSVVGQVLSPVTVWVVDAQGRAITDSTQLVTLSIASGPAGAKLEGTTTIQAVNGVATFTDLTVSLAGTYTLRATGGGLAPDQSNPFGIAPADITTDVRIQHGPPRIVRGHGSHGLIQIRQTLHVTSISQHALGGPLAIVLEDLPPGVRLMGATGTYQGNPYIDIMGAHGSQPRHRSLTVSLVFLVAGKSRFLPHRYRFHTRLLQGV